MLELFLKEIDIPIESNSTQLSPRDIDRNVRGLAVIVNRDLRCAFRRAKDVRLVCRRSFGSCEGGVDFNVVFGQDNLPS